MSGAAIIIGHGPGVGDATARAFAAEGRSVALLARDGVRARQAADAIGGGAIGLTADASDEVALIAALDEAAQRLGDPSVVLYNAALWRPGPVLSTTVDQWLADYRLDVLGAFVAARWAAPRLPKGGALLFTGGGLHYIPPRRRRRSRSARAPSALWR
jgi:NAD(P)-dependent dehydrogenase (short-subunit alcohol dehydrogenase family)